MRTKERALVVPPWNATVREPIDEIEQAVEERKRVPLEVPVTAIYSRRDGVVCWQAASFSPSVQQRSTRDSVRVGEP